MRETQDLATVVAQRWDTLSPKQRAIARALLDTPGLAAASTARDIAAQVGVDPGTVVRFVQALGFRGFSDLRQQLRHRYLGSLSPQDLTADQDRYLTEANALESMLTLDLSNLRNALVTVDRTLVRTIADILCSGRRVLIVSAGSYAAPGLILSHHCQAMGFPVETEVRGGTALAARLATLHENDVVIGVSFWRGYRESMIAVKWARRQGMDTYVITDSVFSPIARVADHVLVVPTEGMVFFQSMTAVISIVNALAVLAWLRGGEQSQQGWDRMRQLYDAFDSFVDEETRDWRTEGIDWASTSAEHSPTLSSPTNGPVKLGHTRS